MKFFLLILLILLNLSSNEEFISEEDSLFKDAIESQEIISQPLEEEQKIESKTLYLKYEDIPEKVYKNQRFSIKLYSFITTDKFDMIKTDFTGGKDVKLLNPDSIWKWSSSNNFENIFYFKITGPHPKIPDFKVSLIDTDFEVIKEGEIEGIEINYSDIALGQQRYSRVIADSISVEMTTTKQYDNKSLLCTFELLAKNGNLEDFSLKEFGVQNVESFTDDSNEQRLLYSVIVPLHTKEIKFDYYNTSNKEFESVIISIELEDGLISTQTDLNPGESNFLFLKRLFFLGLTVVALLLFFIKRKVVFLVVTVVFLTILIILMLPNKKGVISKATKIYILPTKNSTIFKITKEPKNVEILNSKHSFVKILLEDKTIGWVKDNDIKKD